MTLSFTQPLCESCWAPWCIGSRGSYNPPVRLSEAARKEETCCICGHANTHGIWIRIDPNTVFYPTREK